MVADQGQNRNLQFRRRNKEFRRRNNLFGSLMTRILYSGSDFFIPTRNSLFRPGIKNSDPIHSRSEKAIPILSLTLIAHQGQNRNSQFRRRNNEFRGQVCSWYRAISSGRRLQTSPCCFSLFVSFSILDSDLRLPAYDVLRLRALVSLLVLLNVLARFLVDTSNFAHILKLSIESL